MHLFQLLSYHINKIEALLLFSQSLVDPSLEIRFGDKADNLPMLGPLLQETKYLFPFPKGGQDIRGKTCLFMYISLFRTYIK